MAGRSKREPLAELAAFEADSGEVELSGLTRYEPLPAASGTLKVSVPLAPDAAVRDAHAALRDAIAWARSAGYVVSGDLGRILISETGKVR